MKRIRPALIRGNVGPTGERLVEIASIPVHGLRGIALFDAQNAVLSTRDGLVFVRVGDGEANGRLVIREKNC